MLRSGRRSKYYLDKYRFETRPDLLGPLGEAIAAAVAEHEPEARAPRGARARRGRARRRRLARGRAAVPDRPQGRRRTTAPRTGSKASSSEGECVCLVEDVVTSGGAAIEAVEALRRAGLRVSNAICVVDREEGGVDELARHAVRLRPLFRASELLEMARKSAWLSRFVRSPLLGFRAKVCIPSPRRRRMFR